MLFLALWMSAAWAWDVSVSTDEPTPGNELEIRIRNLPPNAAVEATLAPVPARAGGTVDPSESVRLPTNYRVSTSDGRETIVDRWTPPEPGRAWELVVVVDGLRRNASTWPKHPPRPAIA